MESILSYINLQQMVNFVTVVEEHGFLAASEYLHMTQSSISKSIARLEESLGFPLFLKLQKGGREFRDVELTEKGRYLYEAWSAALNDIDNAYKDVASKENLKKKTLHIGYPQTTNPHLYLWPVLQQLADNNRFEVKIESTYRSDLINGLSTGRYDLIFVPDIEYYFINKETMDYSYAAVDNTQVIVPKANPLYERKSLCVDDLRGEKFFIFEDGKTDGQAKMISDFLQRNNITPTIRKLRKDAFNIGNAYVGENSLCLIDRFFLLDTNLYPHLNRIPLDGYYSGILGVWKKNTRMKSAIREFLYCFPDAEEVTENLEPMIHMT